MAMKEESKNFISNCGLHGLNKLHPEERSLYRRILWFIVILASATYLGVTVFTEINLYYSYPTTTKVEVERHKEMTFPAVTVCNLSPYNFSRQPSRDSRYTDFHMSLSFSWYRYVPSYNLSDPFYFNDLFRKPVEVDELFNRSMDINLFIRSCLFDYDSLVCADNKKQVLTEPGPCVTINKDGHMKTKETGTNYNLQLQMNIDQLNYFFSFSDGSGIKVVIHDPAEKPDIYHTGFVVPPGTSGYAAIKRHVHRRLPAPYNSDNPCLDTESSKFANPNSYSNYSVYSCILECYVERAKKTVGCSPANYGGSPPYCALIEYHAFHAAFKMEKTDTSAEGCRSKCMFPCKQVQYDVSVTYGEYPSIFTADLTNNIRNSSYSVDDMRTDQLLLNVFYESLETTKWNQVPRYQSVGDVLANVGGQMGLFLGASLLTLLEVLEFLGVIVTHFAMKIVKAKKKQKGNNKVAEEYKEKGTVLNQ